MLTFFMFIVLPISIGFAENKVFSNKFLNFKITVPNGYQILNSGSSNIPLLIRANNVDFPEFNIVLGNYNSIQKNSAWDKVVKEDYNNVGIPDVEIERTESLKIDSVEVPSVEIRYTLAGISYRAIVTRIETPNAQLILTYKDLADKFSGRKNEFNIIIDRFTFSKSEKIEDSKSYLTLISLTVLGILIISFVTRLILKRS
ncbi:MAG: hypothetical protein SGJ02_00860 [bacterium]|nr:hypothetical protein [bacterium]